jgi:hypothetical protein
VEQDFLGAHFCNHVGMRGHPDPAGRDIAQKRVEPGTVSAVLDGIDPDQDPSEVEQLVAHIAGRIVAVHHALRRDIQILESLEERTQHRVRPFGARSSSTVAPPQQTDAAGLAARLLPNIAVSRAHWMP